MQKYSHTVAHKQFTNIDSELIGSDVLEAFLTFIPVVINKCIKLEIDYDYGVLCLITTKISSLVLRLIFHCHI